MNSFNIQTLFFNQVIIYALCTVVIAVLWWQNHQNFKGVGYWLAGFFIQTCGFGLVLLRGSLSPWLTIILGNALIVGGVILVYIGLEHFLDRRSRQIHNVVLLLIFLGIQTLFTIGQPNMAMRSINVSAALLLIFAQMAWLMLYRVDANLQPITKWTGAVFGVFALLSFIRILVNITIPGGEDLFGESGQFDIFLILAYQILFIVVTFSLSLMINRRLYIDLQGQQQILQSSESRFRQLFELSPMAIAVHAQDKLLFVNAAAASLIGTLAPEDLLGKTVWDFVHPSFRLETEALLDDKLRVGETVPFVEGKLIRLDGSIVDVEITTAPLDYQGRPALQTLIRDITVRKQIAAQLQAYQEQLEAQNLELRKLTLAIEQSGSTIVMTDTNGTIQYANPRFEKTTGYTISEVLGQNPRVLKSGAQSAEFYAEMWQTISSGKIWVGEFYNKRKDGEFYWEFATIAPVQDDAGQVTHYIAVKEDITERKAAADALRLSAEQLAVQNAELDAFAHTVAHDLKNPLGLIMGYAAYLAESFDTLSPQVLQEILIKIKNFSKKLDTIIEELLLLSSVRKEDVQPTPLDMAKIVQDACDRLQVMVEETEAQLYLPEPKDWPAVRGYAPWVEEIWVNYISNALKYGGKPPLVNIGWDTPQEHADQFVRFWVKDQGPGLSPEAQKQLFAPFTRLQQTYLQGHGLGLSIVRRIVEKLGGEVGVESVPGEGACFYFTLPSAAPSNPTELLG